MERRQLQMERGSESLPAAGTSGADRAFRSHQNSHHLMKTGLRGGTAGNAWEW